MLLICIIICYKCVTVLRYLTITTVAVGEYQRVDVVPDSLVEALADVCIDFALLKQDCRKALKDSQEAQEALVGFLPSLFPNKKRVSQFQLLD